MINCGLSPIILSVRIACSAILFLVVTGCQSVNGIAYLQNADGSLGTVVKDVIVDIKPLQGQASIEQGKTDAQGYYDILTAFGPHMVHATHPDYDYFSGGPLDVPGGQAITYDIYLKTKTADVILLTTSLLPQSEALLDAIEEYKQTVYDKEGLVVKYVMLDSDACEVNYGNKLAYPGVYWNWPDTREIIQSIHTISGASRFIILGGRKVVSRPIYNPYSLPPGVVEPPYFHGFRTDGLYLDFNDDYITEEGLVISRMTSLEGESDSVVNALQTATKLHNEGGHTNETEVTFGGETYPAPPYGMCTECNEQDTFLSLLNNTDEIFFLGHGAYYIFNNWDNSAEILSVGSVNPDKLFNFNVTNPIVYAWTPSESGALSFPLDNAGDATSFAYAFLSVGAGAYIAQTSGLNLVGNLKPNFHTLFDNGERIGDAFFQAIRTEALDPDPDHYFFKFHAIQYQLYGDPLLRQKVLN